MFASNFRLGGGCDEYQLVAGDAAQDLLLRAKLLFVAAMVARREAAGAFQAQAGSPRGGQAFQKPSAVHASRSK